MTTRLCTICARGGSKGVPGKNVRDLHGKPLLAHTIEHARDSGAFDTIAVSSDDEHILRTAREYGVDVLVDRPLELASDVAGKPAAIAHAVREAEAATGAHFDTVVDLDVTSPLRLPSDVTAAIALLESSDADNVISAAPARRSPYFNLVELDEGGHVRLSKPLPEAVLRRQDAPRTFDMNASIYVWRRDVFLADPKVFYGRTLLYEMPEERSVDVDSELDWVIVDHLFGSREHA
ncbi:cytidylyltransferase domain-containing protein [Nitriliruptor alkaliphilus]|uniref:acylneuraminate cytidylyltransferase family protein n=1 Tax=Nitriliruptor alkaliphilus TaxID=427918 RepID=UPI0006965825|nr:acylneuraminate cytidylyltransferase family protein [Nitriliruptor alkaliphilus]